jgi:hypothetical protein
MRMHGRRRNGNQQAKQGAMRYEFLWHAGGIFPAACSPRAAGDRFRYRALIMYCL